MALTVCLVSLQVFQAFLERGRGRDELDGMLSLVVRSLGEATALSSLRGRPSCRLTRMSWVRVCDGT